MHTLGTTVRRFCALLAQLTAQAAAGCRKMALAALRWPATPIDRRWSLRHAEQLEQQSNWVLAWPGMVVVCRLIYLGLALVTLLGELTINVLRLPPVLGLPGGRALPVSLDLTLALLYLAMAAFFGALCLEFWDVIPHNVRLFPVLPLGVRRVFRAVALLGFALSVLVVGLINGVGAALLLGILLPELTILINVIQGLLLTIVAVPALWALVLGLLAVLAVICALLWLILAGLSLVCTLLAGLGAPESLYESPYTTSRDYQLTADEGSDWM